MAESPNMHQKLPDQEMEIQDRKMEIQNKDKEIVKLTRMKYWAKLANEQLLDVQNECRKKVNEERLFFSKDSSKREKGMWSKD